MVTPFMQIDADELVRFKDRMGRVIDNLPKAIGEDVFRVADEYAKELSRSAKSKDLKWKFGRLTKLRAKKINNIKSEIPIPVFGFWLDRMDEHWVHRDQLEFNWAEDHGIVGDFIKVHRRPWIEDGKQTFKTKLPRILRKSKMNAELKKLKKK